MSYTISSNEFSDNLIGLSMLSHTRSFQHQAIFKQHGCVQWRCFNTGHGLIYCSLSGRFNEEIRIEEKVDDDYLFLAFNQGSSPFVRALSNDKHLHLHRNLCFSGHMRQGHHSYNLYAKEVSHVNHFLLIDPVFLQNFCIESLFEAHTSFSMFESDYCAIHRANEITKRQNTLLHHISHAAHSLDDSLQALYLESQILELIHSALTLQSPLETEVRDQEIRLSLDDVKSLEKAKKLLLHSLQTPPSIKELAYKSAINEFKLKKGFKTLFGTTIYGMLHTHRLEQAKTLLQHNDMSVQEAAKMVGYKSFSHFSKIFKERYGFLPIQARSVFRSHPKE